ncbi:leukotriene C4 synthase-like [Manacus candei]|uniref:leukotriene C4 synthase-like n=1 Tax=Manacus candei TaxID=415023 RepID=UPI002226DFF9|nr:leukotriene C4 synthase-like [Manacus candei]
MRDQIDQLATITVLGVLEQDIFAKQTLLDCYHSCVVLFLAYFALQVIYARRKYKIPPPETTGHPEFERIFRAQANCSEYFPIFISLLWIAGIFFHQGVAVACGLLYLYTRLKYFQGYTVAAQGRDHRKKMLSSLCFTAGFCSTVCSKMPLALPRGAQIDPHAVVSPPYCCNDLCWKDHIMDAQK